MSFKYISNRFRYDGDYTCVTEPVRYRMSRKEAQDVATQWNLAADVLKENTPDLYNWLSFLVKYTRTVDHEDAT